MELEKKYSKVFAEMDEVIRFRVQRQLYMGLGYTSNLDYLCDFDVQILNRLLAKYLPGADLTRMKVHHKINTLEKLLETMVFYCSRGIGGEAAITDFHMITENFRWQYGMGGTGTQAALALAQIGCPTVVHLTDDSKEVCELLDSPYVSAVSKVGQLVPVSQVPHTAEQEVHCIIQFIKGDVIKLGEQKVVIPLSNRLILARMTVNVTVPFYQPYFNYIEKNAKRFSSIVLSSFNEISDVELLKDRINFVGKHVRKYREGNPDGVVYFEDAHYHDYETRKQCIETLYSQVDIVSMNEDELEYTLKMYDYEVDTSNIMDCVEGANYIREGFRVKKGIIIHTKDYAMYVGNKLAANIEQGLMYGNMLAAAKANNGWYGSKKQIGAVMDLPVSTVGAENRRIVSASSIAGEVILVPSRYIDKPRYTIGLGDSFAAGVQMCFINSNC